MGSEKRDPYEDKTSNYLDNSEALFALDIASGLYKPQPSVPEQKSDDQPVGKSSKSPLFVSSTPDWVIRVASTLTLLLLVGTVYYTRKQWETMDKTYGEIQKQTDSAQCTALAAQKQAGLMQQQLEATTAAIFYLEGENFTVNPCCKYRAYLTNSGHITATSVTADVKVTVHIWPNKRQFGKTEIISTRSQPIKPAGQYDSGQTPIGQDEPLRFVSQETIDAVSHHEKYVQIDSKWSFWNGFRTVKSSHCMVFIATGQTECGALDAAITKYQKSKVGN